MSVFQIAQAASSNPLSAVNRERFEKRLKPHEIEPLIHHVEDGIEYVDIVNLPIRMYQVPGKTVAGKAPEPGKLISLVDGTDWDPQAKRVKSIPCTMKNATTGEETNVLLEVKVLMFGNLGNDPVASEIPTAGVIAAQPAQKPVATGGVVRKVSTPPADLAAPTLGATS